MRKFAIWPAAASLFLASIVVAAPSLYAEGSHDSSGPMMGNGMTGDSGGMMGMMKMMKQMSEMADHCNSMMSDGRPNDQWRKDAPFEPEKQG